MTSKNRTAAPTVEPNQAPAQSAEERAIQRAATAHLMEEDEYGRLVAEQRALQARIKELRAAHVAATSVSKLDREIERQRTQPKWLAGFLCGRVKARVDAGQPYEEAFEQVLAHMRALMQGAAYSTTESN